MRYTLFGMPAALQQNDVKTSRGGVDFVCSWMIVINKRLVMFKGWCCNSGNEKGKRLWGLSILLGHWDAQIRPRSGGGATVLYGFGVPNQPCWSIAVAICSLDALGLYLRIIYFLRPLSWTTYSPFALQRSDLLLGCGSSN
jgi:hypothetical protein